MARIRTGDAGGGPKPTQHNKSYPVHASPARFPSAGLAPWSGLHQRVQTKHDNECTQYTRDFPRRAQAARTRHLSMGMVRHDAATSHSRPVGAARVEAVARHFRNDPVRCGAQRPEAIPAYSAFLSRCVVNIYHLDISFYFLTQQKLVYFLLCFAGLVAMTTRISRRRPGYTAVTGWQPTAAAKSGSGKGGGGR